MKNNKNTNLIEALKEYNKSLSEQISRIKAFIDEIDKQLSHHKKAEQATPAKQIYTPFSRTYLIKKTKDHSN